MTGSLGEARPRGRLGSAMVLLAIGAFVIALYLGITKLQGGVLVCGIVEGCETVSDSEYAEILGIPTGLFGAGASLVTALAALGWWLRAERRALLAAYVVGLLSLPIVIWLTYLEVFVIEAICIWCVTYAVLVIVGWLTASWVLWQGRQEAA